MLNVKKTLTKLLSNFVEVRTDVVKVNHGAISAHTYGYLPFSVGTQTGETLISLSPITLDPALQLTVFYASGGWSVAYYNAYNGQAGAGTFDIRVTHIKVGGGYSLTALYRLFSRLAERRWEYAEYEETSHEIIADNRHIINPILRCGRCLGFIHFCKRMGASSTIWNHIFSESSFSCIKSREYINTIANRGGINRHNKSSSKFFIKQCHHKICELDCDRQGIASFPERGWCCA